ncbi:MAG: 7-cyano-7-deazaguanine synthase [Hyphomicrobiales bacterium]|nr:7-cyano-7-deazaguanine synthase [Hyphomicrobiales bacterium]
MYDAICLASGGLDSLVCLHLLRHNEIKALPLFVDYGQRNRKREFASLMQNSKLGKFPEPIVIDVSGYGKVIQSGLTSTKKRVLEDAFTPNRNLLFLVLAAAVGHTRGVSNIVLGFLSEATAIFPDQTDKFLRLAEETIGESLGVKLGISVPLRDFSKSKVVELAGKFGIKSAYSCHLGSANPCGKCIACLEYKIGG